ncbi:PfkB family carbohydrate kinase [Chthonobacter albigriseus]|uniref:PfkB family carbohydrate kinase n=1 Tax=Chthonobacter albigriseus TaxID=1683161 RepID=UPI0015EE7C20|nr:PfkB family carbohydrate kinase [Chthonobacter albigriseus]
MAVHVVGNADVDLTFVLDRFPAPGETLNARHGFVGLGGKGLNQAVAAARTGASTVFWTAVGRDADGDLIAAQLDVEGIGTARLARLDLPTDRSAILVDPAGENLIASMVECARRFDPAGAGLLDDAVGSGDIVVLQGNLTLGATTGTMRAARAAGARVLFNPSPLGAEGVPPLDLVDILVLNRVEARVITGESDPDRALAALMARGAGRVLLTLGADGAVVADDAGQRVIAAVPVEATDTTGAGDVFAGVLAGLIAMGWPLDRAAAGANRAAAVSVTRPGALASCPSRAEMAALLVEG